jgi:hypothetical protein
MAGHLKVFEKNQQFRKSEREKRFKTTANKGQY